MTSDKQDVFVACWQVLQEARSVARVENRVTNCFK
jgi:hypothetical protein